MGATESLPQEGEDYYYPDDPQRHRHHKQHHSIQHSEFCSPQLQNQSQQYHHNRVSRPAPHSGLPPIAEERPRQQRRSSSAAGAALHSKRRQAHPPIVAGPGMRGVVLGDRGTGKSSLVRRLRGEDPFCDGEGNGNGKRQIDDDAGNVAVIPWHPSPSGRGGDGESGVALRRSAQTVTLHVHDCKSLEDYRRQCEHGDDTHGHRQAQGCPKFVLILIDPRRPETLQHAEEVGEEVLSKRTKHQKHCNNENYGGKGHLEENAKETGNGKMDEEFSSVASEEPAPPLCFLLNFRDLDEIEEQGDSTDRKDNEGGDEGDSVGSGASGSHGSKNLDAQKASRQRSARVTIRDVEEMAERLMLRHDTTEEKRSDLSTCGVGDEMLSTVLCFRSSMKDCYGLSVLHSFMNVPYLFQRRQALERKLLALKEDAKLMDGVMKEMVRDNVSFGGYAEFRKMLEEGDDGDVQDEVEIDDGEKCESLQGGGKGSRFPGRVVYRNLHGRHSQQRPQHEDKDLEAGGGHQLQKQHSKEEEEEQRKPEVQQEKSERMSKERKSERAIVDQRQFDRVEGRETEPRRTARKSGKRQSRRLQSQPQPSSGMLEPGADPRRALDFFFDDEEEEDDEIEPGIRTNRTSSSCGIRAPLSNAKAKDTQNKAFDNDDDISSSSEDDGEDGEIYYDAHGNRRKITPNVGMGTNLSPLSFYERGKASNVRSEEKDGSVTASTASGASSVTPAVEHAGSNFQSGHGPSPRSEEGGEDCDQIVISAARKGRSIPTNGGVPLHIDPAVPGVSDLGGAMRDGANDDSEEDGLDHRSGRDGNSLGGFGEHSNVNGDGNKRESTGITRSAMSIAEAYEHEECPSQRVVSLDKKRHETFVTKTPQKLRNDRPSEHKDFVVRSENDSKSDGEIDAVGVERGHGGEVDEDDNDDFMIGESEDGAMPSTAAAVVCPPSSSSSYLSMPAPSCRKAPALTLTESESTMSKSPFSTLTTATTGGVSRAALAAIAAAEEEAKRAMLQAAQHSNVPGGGAGGNCFDLKDNHQNTKMAKKKEKKTKKEKRKKKKAKERKGTGGVDKRKDKDQTG